MALVQDPDMYAILQAYRATHNKDVGVPAEMTDFFSE